MIKNNKMKKVVVGLEFDYLSYMRNRDMSEFIHVDKDLLSLDGIDISSVIFLSGWTYYYNNPYLVVCELVARFKGDASELAFLNKLSAAYERVMINRVKTLSELIEEMKIKKNNGTI